MMTVKPALERSLGDHALDQGALFGLGAGGRVAADLPVAVHRFDSALGMGGAGADQKGGRQRRTCKGDG